MKQYRLWSVLLALLGFGMLSFLILRIAVPEHSHERSLITYHDRVTVFHGRMAGYSEHAGFHHAFGILPIIFVLFILLMMFIWLIYRRVNRHRTNYTDQTYSYDYPMSPPVYSSNADYLDEWEKHIQQEAHINGNHSKD